MSVDANTLLVIIGMALATYLTRIAGLWLLQLANVRGRARSAMDALPPAVLMAVIAPTVLATGLAETLAAASHSSGCISTALASRRRHGSCQRGGPARAYRVIGAQAASSQARSCSLSSRGAILFMTCAW